MALEWKRSSFEPEASDVFRAAAARRREAVRGLLSSALKLGVWGWDEPSREAPGRAGQVARPGPVWPPLGGSSAAQGNPQPWDGLIPPGEALILVISGAEPWGPHTCSPGLYPYGVSRWSLERDRSSRYPLRCEMPVEGDNDPILGPHTTVVVFSLEALAGAPAHPRGQGKGGPSKSKTCIPL